MPIYEYYCPKCNPGGADEEKMVEIFVKPDEVNTGPPIPNCDQCSGMMKRALSVVGHSYKGSGFYATDYKQSDKGKKERK